LLAASGRITVFVPAAVLTQCIIYYITQALRQLPAMPPKSAGKSKGPDGMALVMAAVRHPQCSRQHLRVTHICMHACACVHTYQQMCMPAAEGQSLSLAQVAELEKIMEEIPPDFIPQFEEAAKGMISAFKDGAAGGKDAVEEDHRKEGCASAGWRLPVCLCGCECVSLSVPLSMSEV